MVIILFPLTIFQGRIKIGFTFKVNFKSLIGIHFFPKLIVENNRTDTIEFKICTVQVKEHKVFERIGCVFKNIL